MRFRAPANVLLRRAQFTLILAGLVPTILMSALGIVLLAIGSRSVNIVAGVLVLAFCTSAVTGYILVSILLSRGAAIARFQSDYLSTVSHELNTPITAIKLFVETLRDGRLVDNDEQKRCFDLLHRELNRLEELVTKLFAVTRMEMGRHVFAHEPVLISDVIADALAAFEAATLNNSADVDVQSVGDLVVTGDRPALTQLVSNLLTNAWKYGLTDDRRIFLSAQPSGDRHIEITVADHGPGIPRDEHKKIFEKFERGSAAVDGRAPGSGLGLAIVKAIVRAHKGKVEVRSKLGQGSEFRIRLPRRRTLS